MNNNILSLSIDLNDGHYRLIRLRKGFILVINNIYYIIALIKFYTSVSSKKNIALFCSFLITICTKPTKQNI